MLSKEELLEQSKDDCPIPDCQDGYLPNDDTGEPNPPVGGIRCPICNTTGKVGEPHPERIVVLKKGEQVVNEEYDPQAEEFGWFLKRGWIPPEQAEERKGK